MTAMPQLVAAFHSLVGLAAVLVGVAAYLNPAAFGIAELVVPLIGQPFASIHPASRIELGLGVAIGAQPLVQASYDLDLFGRLRQASAAARAQALASEGARDTVRLVGEELLGEHRGEVLEGAGDGATARP